MEFFFDIFSSLYQDRIASVRIEYTNAVSAVRLKYAAEMEIQAKLCEGIDQLKNDRDRVVMEAAERSEVEYL